MNALQAFQTILGLVGSTWLGWCALLGGAFGCPLPPDMDDFFRTVAGREPLTKPCRELWLAVGRRGGKNRAAAAVAIYLALFKKWTLAPGETGVVLVAASDRTQARSVAYRYLLGLLQSIPVIWQEVANVTADTITLRNGIEITIATADNAAVRGRTIVAAILDEFAFWPYEQATEVLRALRPGMATQPDSMLIVISSVYAAQGPFYEARRTYYGTDDPRVLFAVATSQQMNPTLSDEFIQSELARDPAGNAAEYLSVERSDVASFLDAALVDGATRSEPRELPTLTVSKDGGPVHYVAGLDASGGRGDSTTAAVCHLEGGTVVVDAVRAWKSPHDPAVIAREVANFLKPYRLHSATADRYAAEFARSVYREAGVTLTDAGANRSELYLHLLPLLTTGRVELPPEPRLRQELLGLERRTSRNGRDSVDHRPGAHDDLANSVALACWVATQTLAAGDSEVFAVETTLFNDYGQAFADEGIGSSPWSLSPMTFPPRTAGGSNRR